MVKVNPTYVMSQLAEKGIRSKSWAISHGIAVISRVLDSYSDISMISMNGLRYHYQHSGAHGALGLTMLAQSCHPPPCVSQSQLFSLLSADTVP